MAHWNRTLRHAYRFPCLDPDHTQPLPWVVEHFPGLRQ